VGIETYPSPTIGTDRKSNVTSCFIEIFLSSSIAILAARQLLAAGVDPSLKRGELRRVGLGVG